MFKGGVNKASAQLAPITSPSVGYRFAIYLYAALGLLPVESECIPCERL